MFDFIAFDLETTGLEPDRSEILEVAAVKFQAGRIVDKFVSLVDPKIPIPADATRVNGITDDMVAGKPAALQVLKEFAVFCQGSLLVAHNAPFDEKFITHNVKKHKCAAPRGLILDTLSISRRAAPGMMSYRLESLVKYFKLPESTFHRAEADAALCGLVFLELVKLIAAGQKKLELKKLVNLSNGERYFPQIPQEPEQLGFF